MMKLAARLSSYLSPGKRDRSEPRTRARNLANRRARAIGWEPLETRQLLSGVGTDFTLMGGKWDNSRPISFSFAPDGVGWDSGTNDANAKLDAEFGGTAWQGMVAKALQTWAAVSNLNFTQVSDGAFAFNASGVNEGDPSFGDIRVGGYNFNNTGTIARTYGPPPNGQTGAGDVELNTGFNFAPGAGYDFGTVVLHELGHSLGLGESPQPVSVMYTYYHGNNEVLSNFDIEGIQSLYGARVDDYVQSLGLANKVTNAIDVTSQLNPAHQGLITGTGLSTIGDTEYFSVQTPQLNGSTLQVSAKATGYSMLSPKVSVVDPATGAVLAAYANPAAYGNTATITVPNAVAGHRYVIEVTGATKDVFAVGSYGLVVGFNGGSAVVSTPVTPVIPVAPVTPTPVATPTPTPVASTPVPVTVTAPAPVIQADPYAYNNNFSTSIELGPVGQATIGNLTLPSSSNYQMFTFEAPKAGTITVSTFNSRVGVANSSGIGIGASTSSFSFTATAPGQRFFLNLSSPNGLPIASYGFAIKTVVASVVLPPRPTINVGVSASTKLKTSSNLNVAPVAKPKVIPKPKAAANKATSIKKD